jgi:hypothetical protein
VYNTATAFEKVTTRKPAKKVLNSCRIIHQGGELSLLKHYFERHLADFGVEVPPSELFRLVGDWARDQLEAAGVKVGLAGSNTWAVGLWQDTTCSTPQRSTAQHGNIP